VDRAAKSLLIFGIYRAILGASLIFAPRLALHLLGGAPGGNGGGGGGGGGGGCRSWGCCSGSSQSTMSRLPVST